MLELLAQYNITDYFFLDSSFPMIVSLVNKEESKIALRFSEFEGLDSVRKMAGKVQWLWVDCFSKLPINKKVYDEIKHLRYKICLVSPELQGRKEDIAIYRKQLEQEEVVFDAICCKLHNMGIWL